MTTPSKPGAYWGRWHTPSPLTADNGEMCSGNLWEVHQVFKDGTGTDPDELLAFVPGIEASQSINAFEWGPKVPEFQPAS